MSIIEVKKLVKEYKIIQKEDVLKFVFNVTKCDDYNNLEDKFLSDRTRVKFV